MTKVTVDRERMTHYIVQAVCEIPDRTSPEDQPDMLMLTVGELEMILEIAFGLEAENP